MKIFLLVVNLVAFMIWSSPSFAERYVGAYANGGHSRFNGFYPTSYNDTPITMPPVSENSYDHGQRYLDGFVNGGYGRFNGFYPTSYNEKPVTMPSESEDASDNLSIDKRRYWRFVHHNP